jgi:hypothetical protein
METQSSKKLAKEIQKRKAADPGALRPTRGLPRGDSRISFSQTSNARKESQKPDFRAPVSL